MEVKGLNTSMKKRKILFIVPSMGGGGAERVILTLVKYLPRDRFELCLALVKMEGPFLQEIPNDVSVFDLQASRVRYAIPRIVSLIKKQAPDVVFTTLGHLNIALLMVKRFLPENTRLIVREASIVSSILKNSAGKRIWTGLYRSFYPKADMIICQSIYMLDDLTKEQKISSHNLKVIYNPVDIEKILRNSKQINPFKADKNYNVIAVGRLDKPKAFHRIINAFPALLNKEPEAKLWIIGDGPLLGELEELVQYLGLKDNVHFVGFQKNPYTWMAYADLFVLSSIYEGLPNVLLEAIACNCPVISLQHPGGTREILELTDQTERYVNNLSWERWWFDCPSLDVQEKLQEHFGLDSIIGQYSDLLAKI